jgi:hypothetical protein
LRPNLTAMLLMIPTGVVLAFPTFNMTFKPGSGASVRHLELGIVTWFRADDPGSWELNPVVIPLALGWYLVPTLIGAALARWRRWHLAPRWLLFFAAVPVLSVASGVVFSHSYWGYAWSLPELDSRVHAVHWRAVSGFESRQDGSGWTVQSRELLSHHRTEEAADSECCADGRILKVTGLLPDLGATDLASLEGEVLAQVPLEAGQPGYPYARRLHGVVAVGEDEHHRPVAFASFSGGEVSNDHHAMYEVLLLRSLKPEVLSANRYYADVAGIEGLTGRVVSLSLFALGTLLFSPLLILGAALRALVSALRQQASSA